MSAEPPPAGSPRDPVNRLHAKLLVQSAGNSPSGIAIGQIHIDDSVSAKPVCQLFYNSTGAIVMAVEQTTAGGNAISTYIGTVALNQIFTYDLSYENNVLSVSLNQSPPITLSTYSLNAPKSYFKVGNYNQGDTASDIHMFAISVNHSSVPLPRRHPSTTSKSTSTLESSTRGTSGSSSSIKSTLTSASSSSSSATDRADDGGGSDWWHYLGYQLEVVDLSQHRIGIRVLVALNKHLSHDYTSHRNINPCTYNTDINNSNSFNPDKPYHPYPYNFYNPYHRYNPLPQPHNHISFAFG